MPFVFKCLALFLSITAALAADKDAPFRTAAPARMAYRQSSEQVTIGVDPYSAGDKIKAAFGKLDPNQYGVLPLLVVIQNDTNKSLRLDNLRVEYLAPNRSHIEATPAGEVRYVSGPSRPGVVAGPAGGVKVISKKNPLNVPEIESRAFAAKMIPPGQTASGFFYFQTGFEKGSTAYISGIAEAPSGRELLYFEIPMD